MGAERPGPRDRDGEVVAGLRAPPPAPHAAGVPGRLPRAARAHAAAVCRLRHHQVSERSRAVHVAQIQLHPVGVDVVGLVVESQRRRIAGPEADVRLRHVDREVQRLVIPAGIGERR